ncbi:hypothetical protein B0H13DRAFT_2665128 [Mycena leptocephala]|nr:hypothetical protein B0H13DRAFT_2674179 [Mycena leptocephala]KAJ7895402.1 hypothetical protein B0H13DRAFT_2665128 [Mycena leptocephala]
MKYILSAIFLSVVVCLTAALDIPELGRRSSQTCGAPTDVLPFYRLFASTGNIYLYTINVQQVTGGIAGDGYILEDVAALVFITQEESTVPLYRLFSATAVDNIYTTSTTERDNAIKNGYTLITVLQAYAYPTQVCGSVPFYHLFESTQNTNFYTASASERLDFIANGYQDMGIAAYVLPVSATQCA